MSKTSIITKARYLRKEETKAEKILWQKLRNNKLSIKWRRQHPIDMFIVDFYAPSIKFAIELDGSIHNLKENKEYDEGRTNYLNSKFITVLRFLNSDIEKNINEVVKQITKKVNELLLQ